MILASFPAGATNITVNGLTQWDYGQKLKIQAADLPSMIEVHFWCVGMDEAVVRSCSVWKGEAEAAIPDRCLEQAGPIIAWVYEVYGSAGTTTKTITMPIIARVRPQTSATVPEDISDKYTEALTAMNSIVGELKNGNVVVGRAISADKSTNATHATEADRAAKAELATYATTAHGVSINGNTPFRPPLDSTTSSLSEYGYYCIKTFDGSTTVIYWDGANPQRFRHPNPDVNQGIYITGEGDLYAYDVDVTGSDYIPISVYVSRLWG